MSGFVDFIRKQGVIGLTIGFILGGAISKLTAAIVADVINPLLALAINTSRLQDKAFAIGSAHIMWGDLVATFVDFLVVAGVVYFGFKMLRLEGLDKQD